MSIHKLVCKDEEKNAKFKTGLLNFLMEVACNPMSENIKLFDKFSACFVDY